MNPVLLNIEGLKKYFPIRSGLLSGRQNAMVKALYEEVIETGATNFKIVFDAMIRAWDDFPHKFSGECAEPTDWYLEVELVDSK